MTSIAGRALFGKRKHLIFCYACVHVCDANAPRENSMENSNSRSHDKCTVCRDNCPAKLHIVLKNIPQMFARDLQDNCKEAEKLNQKRQQKQQNCCNSYKDFENLEPILTECMISVGETLDQVDDLALRTSHFTDTKFLKWFIEKEKSNYHGEGVVEKLQKLLSESEILEAAQEGQFQIPEVARHEYVIDAVKKLCFQ